MKLKIYSYWIRCWARIFKENCDCCREEYPCCLLQKFQHPVPSNGLPLNPSINVRSPNRWGKYYLLSFSEESLKNRLRRSSDYKNIIATTWRMRTRTKNNRKTIEGSWIKESKDLLVVNWIIDNHFERNEKDLKDNGLKVFKKEIEPVHSISSIFQN